MGHQDVPNRFTTFHCHHRPPPSHILNSHHPDEIENLQLQQVKTKLMVYNFTTEWIKGVLSNVPDALSQYPVSISVPQEMVAEHDPDDEQAVSFAEI